MTKTRRARSKKSQKLAFYKLIMVCIFTLTLLTIGSAARNIQYRVTFSAATVATAYNSMEGQTDSTPWITASGSRCRDGVIAANFLPIGTKVLIEGFGNKVFTVEDRMNRRFNKRIDIWFATYNDARKFGIRKIKFHVLKVKSV